MLINNFDVNYARNVGFKYSKSYFFAKWIFFQPLTDQLRMRNGSEHVCDNKLVRQMVKTKQML